jgi:hypothetical protein
MKTAESLIKDEIGKTLIDLAIHKINHWARSELNYIRYVLDKPILIPINNKLWIIGNYAIQHIDTHKYKVTRDKEIVHTFYSKQAAVFYTALTKIKQYRLADGLLYADIKVARLYDECEFYSKKINSPGKKDSFKLDLWLSRYNNVRMKLSPARNDLEKRITSAKYIKIWETLI